MEKRVPVGTDIFSKLVSNNNYYVDKSELIYDLLTTASNEVTLFTRPRRFGKTLNMSMMESFFDLRQDSRELFRDLNIQNNHPDFCSEWMNQYPVLFLSFKDVEGLTFHDAYDMLVDEISDLCDCYSFLEKDDRVSKRDAALLHRLLCGEPSKADIKKSLKTLMRMLNAVYGRQVILLIDEYDVPLAKAHTNGYYHDMLDVMCGLLSTSLKTNPFLKFAVVTGCLRIPKESIFTGVNNFASYSVLDEDFSQYFGFTQDEIEALLLYYGLENKLEVMQKWYDGYVFGGTKIYCPWDVMCFAASLRKREEAEPESYWENTSGNDAVAAIFEFGKSGGEQQIEMLLNGGTIIETVSNALTYTDAYQSESNLWSILLMTGYVTAVKQKTIHDKKQSSVELRIPNREIAEIFRKAAGDHFERTVDQNRINELMQALWNGDEEMATKILSDLLFDTISFMDYHEDYYHAFVTGIFAGRGYVPRSNQERGLGRPDGVVRDKKNRRAMIIEVKRSDSSQRMEYWCDEAIRQIADCRYAENLNGYRTVLCYGIAFYQKSARVKRMREN